ncbi:hypothetical protein [Gracilibacillus halophilus]|uniref:DUF2264 C-terminal domain-containing protein n=1 Tax=Gracilibacillus halophilus TaxID=470864 RepID=UPI00039A8608|nr:hypothetical protein [Gracilibacillus halophilus]
MHRIVTKRPLDIADGGFALGLADDDENQVTDDHDHDCSKALSTKGMVASLVLGTKGKAHSVFPNANTNLMENRTVIPTISAAIESGEHVFIHAFYGKPGKHHMEEQEEEMPSFENGKLYLNGQTYVIKDWIDNK